MPRPAVLIVKRDRQLKVYSDSDIGRDAWVLDWDNNMKPTPMSAVYDSSMVHPVQIQRMTPDCNKTLDALECVVTRQGRDLSLDDATTNCVIAALRLLQLSIEKGEVPQGIRESFFEEHGLPDPEALDHICDAFNFDEEPGV